MSTENEISFEGQEPATAAEQVVPPLQLDEKLARAQLRQDYKSVTPEAKVVTYRFSLPPVDRPTLSKVLTDNNNNPNLKLESKTFKDWREVVTECSDHYTTNDLYLDRVQDPDSLWLQGVEKPDHSLLGIASPKFKNLEGGELKGEMAVLQFSKRLGVGDVLTVPLPHSGIVVTLKPPTERDLIDFYNSIFREKVYLGRMSAGLTLTNLSVYLNNRVFEFIVKHIHSVNYSDISKEQLRTYLNLHDFHILAWGFAATMYPNGFDYQRPCVNNIEKCNHVEREVINMLKLLWVDNTSLTQPQKDILYDVRPNKHTAEVFRKFTAEHTRVKASEVTLKNGIKFYLKVPTFAEHTADGLAWVNRINTVIDNLIVADDTEENADKAKQELLQQHVSSSYLRQFSHFIDYIEDEDNNNVVKDRDTINQLLEVFSVDDDTRAELTKAILKFKSDTTIALIGIPTYECPACKTEQNTAPVGDRFVSVIPLDVLNLFFTLLTLRMSKILERE